MLRRLARPFLRWAFHLFYNPFAFTYDFVSAVVSGGHWREWTRAAIPRIAGTRILELPCGTGNLLLDLASAGYAPVGVDLSPSMLGITRGKFARQKSSCSPQLVRARAEALPFPTHSFDTVVMTFPPEFVYDPQSLAEFHRVLDDSGRLIWVDAGRQIPRDRRSRALNAALDAVGGDGSFSTGAGELLARAGFDARLDWVRDAASVVAVITAEKRGADWIA